MNTVWKSLVLSVTATALVACGGDGDQNAAVPQNYHDIKTNLQGTVFDAVTGERVIDESLAVLLVQGDDYRDAKMNADFPGDYFLKDIPTSTSNNVTFRMEVTATNYQSVISAVSFTANTSNLQDETVWRMGNFYMYPMGSTAPDMTVTVTYNGERIADATVLLQPNTASNVLTADAINSIAPTNGFQGALSGTTDAEGNVTFAGTELVLGGRYAIDVLPMTYEDTELALTSGSTVVVGTSQISQVVAMDELAPGSDNGLYVESASNEDPDQLASDGVLTMTLSRAVTLADESSITATLVNETTAELDNTETGSEVTVTVSADGMTVTFTPNFSTAPVEFNGDNADTADNGLRVYFDNAYVRLADETDSAVAYDLFNLTDGSGNTVDDTVLVTSEF